MMKIIIIICCTLLFYSCQKEIEFKGKDAETELAVNALLFVDSIPFITVNKTKNILEEESIESVVKTATVTLTDLTYANDILFTHQVNGVYSPPLGVVIQPNHDYKLTVDNADYTSLTLAEKSLDSIPILAIAVVEKQSQFDQTYQISITIDDPVATTDFYGVELWAETYDFVYDSITFQKLDSTLVFQNVSAYQVESDNRATTVNGQIVIYSDALLNGKRQKLAVNASAYEVIPGSNIIVKLHHLSASYYKYLVSYVRQQDSDNPFSEPSPMFSNSSNGIGVLGFSAISTATIIAP